MDNVVLVNCNDEGFDAAVDETPNNVASTYNAANVNQTMAMQRRIDCIIPVVVGEMENDSTVPLQGVAFCGCVRKAII